MSSKKNTKTGQFTSEKNEEIRKQAASLTVEGALRSIAEVQARLGATLAGVGEQLQSKLQELNTVKTATVLEKEELERIHGVGVIAKSIEEIQADFENKKLELAREEANFIAELNDRKQAAARAAQVEITNLSLNNQREKENFAYAFEIEKRDQRNTFAEEMRIARVQERDRKDTLERGWIEREANIKKQESEIAELRAKVANFQNELAAEVSKQVNIVTNVMKKDKEHEIQMLQNNFGAARTVADNTIKNLTEQLVAKDKIISDLSANLISAEKKVETIATKALETASGRQALADLQSIQQNNNGIGARAKT